MNDINRELIQLLRERSEKLKKAGDFLKSHTDSNGTISKLDAEKYEILEKDAEDAAERYNEKMIEFLGGNEVMNKPILMQPGDNGLTKSKSIVVKFGVSGREYRQEFLNQVRTGFSQVQNYLQVADPTQGGYLLPSEMHESIIVKLRDKNILRQIGRVIQTASTHKITIQATAPTAQWTPEGQPINLSSMTFDQKALDAYKLTVGLSISNEVKADSYYNLEEHITNEFSTAIAELEEQTFFNGDGDGNPLGLLPQLQADTDATITTAGASIAADDLINLIHKLPRPYRSNACFVMDDTTLAAIRKLKDVNQNYLWEPALQQNEPSKLFGYSVYTSPNVPTIASGNLAVIFGDFSKFLIGQRGNLTFRPLYEIHALQDLSTYIMLERVDTVITDTNAIVGLKIKTT